MSVSYRPLWDRSSDQKLQLLNCAKWLKLYYVLMMIVSVAVLALG